ncbi:MAG: glycosyltransferase family A protein [Pyrinomonadaceae bacterium]
MPEQPLVSIIMPAYNAEKYVAAPLRSVLDQTYSRWELVVVDDGSTDKTALIVRGFADSDSRIRYIFQPNGRMARARNNGISNARGELIAFLDSDDLWLRDKLERQIEKLAETNADVIFSDGFVFTDEDVFDESVTFKTLRGSFSGEEMYRLLLYDNRVPLLSALVRKSVLQRAGLFDEQQGFQARCEDYDLWFRVASAGATFYGMEQALVRYRVHSASMSGNKVEMMRATIATVKKYMDVPTAQSVALNKRFRVLYRALTAALLEQKRMDEAKESFRELCKWDRFGFVTSIQRVLIKVAPGKYNRLSDRLYEAGSRVNSFRAKLR